MSEYGKINNKVSDTIILCLFLSFFLQSYHLQAGFAIKIFMVLIPLAWLLFCNGKVASKFFLFEWLWFFFIFSFSLTSVYSYDIEASLRMTFGLLTLIVLYLFWVSVLAKISIVKLITYIKYSGIIFNIISLVLYLAGLYVLNGDFGYKPQTLGVLPDRGIPRLIGPLQDPNFFIAFNALFLIFFITYNNTKFDKCALVLCITTTLLTFSRGGLLAVFMALIFMSLFKKNGVFQVFLLTAFTFTISIVVINLFPSVLDFVDKRVGSAAEGSGRFGIWSNAFSVFLDKPEGIGIFSFLSYNRDFFGDFHYMHNTYLEILVEGGVFVFIIYMLFIATFFVTIFRNSKGTPVQVLPPALLVISLSFVSLSGYANEYWLFFLGISRSLLIGYSTNSQPKLGFK